MGRKGVELETRCTLIAVAFDKAYEGGEFNGQKIAPHGERYSLSFVIGKLDKNTGLFPKVPKLAKECFITVDEYYKHDFKRAEYDCVIEENRGNYSILEIDGIEIVRPEGEGISSLSDD